ncbi:MAG TPA: tRNA pseudouridine(55) synthase TruB [Bacillota bacterium]|nr:tRNA pseudouridine(55) synthase TruB [Bacillota bacterium]HPT88740.1 tRNA pseudouridine(55) synthase TruB [Bacillota bacterium]
MWHGILVIHKERGVTSHQVVARLRRLLGQSAIGHSGTLDPEATGVLVIGLGEGTRSFQFLNESEKVYKAEVIFGQATDTQDATGTVLWEKPEMCLTPAEIESAVRELTGTIDQMPPMYSAVKIQGKKLYELARAGMDVERQSRKITVYEWTSHYEQPVYGFGQRLMVTIRCSKGTYIRTLVHDLGMKLGCGAHMGSLVRLSSGDFTLEQALTLEQVEQCLNAGTLLQKIIPLTEALSHLKSILPKTEDLKKICNGGKLSFYRYPAPVEPGALAKVVGDENRLMAIVRLEDNGNYRFWQPMKVFRYQDKS